MPNFAFEYWDRIDEILRKRHLSYKELAAAIDVSYDVVRQWKSKNRYPKGNLPLKIANWLKVSNDYLITGIENSQKEETKEETNNPDYTYITKMLKDDPTLASSIANLIKSIKGEK